MESVPDASPKTRPRFGFTGKRTRAQNVEKTVVTTDDILDSLTRQAASQIGTGEQRTQRLELLSETEEPTLISGSILDHEKPLKLKMGRNLGRYVIVAMCLGGMLVVWLYSIAGRLPNMSVLTALVPEGRVQAVFANTAQAAVITVAALILALWVAIRRRTARLRMLG